MTFTKIRARDFDLEKTLNSGQVFHWEKVGDGFVGTIGDWAVYVEQRAGMLRVSMEGGAPATPGGRRAKRLGSQELAPPVQKLVAHYFALAENPAAIRDRRDNGADKPRIAGLSRARTVASREQYRARRDW